MKKNEYQVWANEVQNKLKEDSSWVGVYKDYAIKMIKNKEEFIKARRKFRVYQPLKAYLTIGKIKDKKVSFDLRYLGQSVGTIEVKDEKVLLSVDFDQAKNSQK